MDAETTAPKSQGAVGALLDRLDGVLAPRPASEHVALRELVAAIEGETFAVMSLLFALLMVSPLSAIPTATTIFGLSIAIILMQWLAGRRSVWLPGLLLDRRLPVGRLRAALAWLAGPVARVERYLRPRQHWALAASMTPLPTVVVLAAALCAPLLELIPMSGTSVGAAIALFSAGRLVGDGIAMLVGATLAAVLPVGLWLLLA